MTQAPPLPRLRHGERLLLRERESRYLRTLADGFVCTVSMGVGVAFHWAVTGGTAETGFGVLLTIALTLAPIFAFMAMRPLSQVFVTDQRLFVGADANDMRSADYHQITQTRRWLATLFIRLRSGETFGVGNMRSLHAIEAEIRNRSCL